MCVGNKQEALKDINGEENSVDQQIENLTEAIEESNK